MKISDALAVVALFAALLLASSPNALNAAEKAEAKADAAEEATGAEAAKDEGDQATTAKKPAKDGLDRNRGTIAVSKEDGNYQDGSHFAKWHWTIDPPRWGMYNVHLIYTSVSPKIGIQAKIGQFPALKSYVPRTGGIHKEQRLELGRVYVDKAGEYPLFVLTGDKSNGPSVFIKGVELVPAPESSPTHQSDNSDIITRPHSGEIGQSIDGNIELPAGGATTWSKTMRYEPKPEKNCLGFWTDVDDWAEWSFKVHTPGRYKLEVVQGCGEGQGGSKVGVQVGLENFEFDVVDTGGFQKWKTVEIGEVDLNAGTHQLSIKPKTKTAKAVCDIHKVLLTPIR